MTTHHIAVPALSFNGVEIHARNEMLSLTDMWKAQGADPARRPVDWLRGEQAKRFILFMAEDLGMGEVGKSHFGLVRGARGGEAGGATFAHWQVAMAYAKYLSPEFHMWCNTVVRERMEGKPAGLVPADVRELLERTNGMCKSVVRDLTEMKAKVTRLEAAHVAPTFDLAGTVTSDTMIEMAGIARKDRVRGTSAMITSAMLDFCGGSGCFRTPSDLNPARPWRFPRDKAREWLFGESYGAERTRNQIAAQKRKKDKTGQRTMHLVPMPDRPGA